MKIIDAFQLYMDYVRYERMLSRNTHIEYVRDINDFIKVAHANKVRSIHKIKPPVITQFKIALRQKKLSARTIFRKISTLRTWFRWLAAKHKFDYFEVVSPKYETTLPEICSPELIQQIVEFMQKESISDQLLFKLFYSTGIRASEIIKLQIKDINFSDRLILIHGKGNKERLVPFPDAITQDIKDYIKTLPDTYLFPYNRQRVWYIIKTVGDKMGVKLYPHKLRHSIATHFLENGFNLRAIQKFLGHESILTTSIYTHVSPIKLKDIYNKYHPRS